MGLDVGDLCHSNVCTFDGQLKGELFSWADMVRAKECFHNGLGLTYEPPVDTRIFIHNDDVSVGMEKWKNALIGFVMGRTPVFSTMKRFCEEKWSSLGHVDCTLLRNGLFVFNCSFDEMKRSILEQSPWPFASQMLFIKPWTPEMDLTVEDFASVPIWVRFLGLNWHYYTPKGLNKLASNIGKPLYTDKITAQ